MSDNKEKRHTFDGIYELDNPAPAWWQWIFYLSIIWGFLYWAYYSMLGGPTLTDELNQKMKAIEVAKLSQPKKAGPTEESLKAVVAQSTRVEAGKGIFVAKCAACHRADGGGLVGPSLADDAWIHGDGSLLSIYQVIDQGVPAKGMPPWGPILKPDELENVTAYVKGFQGTKPVNPKAPQGPANGG